ncbi:MAG: aromatic ring-hydroxylating dioxygenase subunit alpha [Labilithrix sp.]|nr:aromatic ring-hydroxylating dioxygenase subunit alpha [Labilithrix sp.]
MAPLERAAAFERGWICAGRVEDVVEPGDFIKVPLTRAGVVVARGNDGRLRGFHAVCTHRGAAFIDAEAGRGARFRCPYHGFEFELDGKACAGVADLMPVRIDTAMGFVFLTLDANAPPLTSALGEAPPWLARAALGELRLVRRIGYDVAADWKLVMENFQESLHFPTVHPSLERLTPSSRAETWLPEGGPWLGGVMPIAEEAETVSRSARRNDRPFVVPPEDRRVVHDALRFPNLLTSLQPDYLLTFVVFPIRADLTRVFAGTYVARSHVGPVDDVTSFWDEVYDEDRRACERQQRGAESVEHAPTFTAVEEGVAAFSKMVADALVEPAQTPAPPAPRSRLCGIFGRPYVDLSPFIDTSCFPELHAEITRGLALVETSYTGGSLKWMGVCAPWIEGDGYRDAMHAIRAMTRDERDELVALGDHDPASIDLDDPAIAFGDETDRPFNKAQALFLEQRHGVYFPWKACYHLLDNVRWEDKHSGEDKDFSEEARRVFPKTIAFLESLPMTEMGRVVVFGLLANDHAPLHRDSEPGKALSIAQSITFAPAPAARKKRFYLASPDGAHETEIDAPIYWFNDMDWHGVHDDPFFRYSVRCDGVFEPAFLERLRRSRR